MARISGVDLPQKKRIGIALTYIYGIGISRANLVLKDTGIDPFKKVANLTEEEVRKLRDKIESQYKVEGALHAEVQSNIKRLVEIGCHRGARHKKGLPVRGQRTRTNARTRKGPKKTSGISRKKKPSGKGKLK